MRLGQFARTAAVVLTLCTGMPLWAASDEAPDVMVKRLSADVVDAARAAAPDANDRRRIALLVDTKVMPNVNFARMTAAAVGRAWRQASPEQQERLQEEFKGLLLRTYAGALAQIKDQTVQVKPLRVAVEDNEVTVRTLVKGQGDPIQVDYRLERTSAGWKIVDLNVMGVWLVEAYRGQFAAEIGAHGIDGLIATLSERNRLVAKAS